ncbi:LysR family transcriptional regulator [Vibrio methylphosphonaticus]|uniref:LysR family transcriptional regulator n=1 Tax=Vibrio methylphosphonaticus TaxID=2946866 RepID=UPI00202A7F85|nr:LysR family transcriptional regulator [Vibrio methylphosphonaticus]MCL9777221.1 LysR family transcriptional regulator [Vibrio methylphosphonaticus]
MQHSITLEALNILDAIDRRGSFAAAAVELDRATSSLSYQIQKLEQELDIMIFDRSGHKAALTDAGRLILERGRVILQATETMVHEARLLANGWELDLTIAYDSIIPVANFFELVDKLGTVSKTRVKLDEEVLAGCWESLNEDRSDLLVCPQPEVTPQGVKTQVLGSMSMTWVAASDHYVHKRSGIFDSQAREKYRVIAIADTAREQPALSVNILEKQPRLTVSNLEAKIEALVNGLGIGTLPTQIAEPLIKAGKLSKIDGTKQAEIDIVLAWKRNNIGEAKSWCIKHLTKNWNLK